MRDLRHLCAPLLAAGALVAPAMAAPRPEPTPAPAVEVARTPGPIHVDGRLDDEAWALLEPFIDFVQRDPDEGMPATESTELLLAYDDEALYVGARLHDSEPERIEARLSRRDDHSESDRFAIYLDPRGDRRTGVRFEVTAAGVQRDEIIFNDTWTDRSWDALWASEVTVDERGWSVEMRIPFSELRFLPGDSYAWGVNALRIIQRKNETDWLALVPRGESGLASRMAPLEGIEGVRPRAPLVLIPYAAAGTELGPVDAGDPLRDGSTVHGSVGLDLRRKVGGSFALDATVNPDFGQVEVDPAVVNLSDSETFYPEKRPFFVQGRQTFDSFGSNGPNNHYGFGRSEPDLFYTRRIGRPPQGAAGGDYVLTPQFTTILGAAKLTGKTVDGWSVGVLDAVTASESARWVTGEDRGRQQVEPLANYFVARAFRDTDRAGYGGVVTAVNRDLADPGLQGQLARTACVGGVDGYVFVDARKDWVVGGRLAGSWVSGSQEAIQGLQLASQRYFQRPDRREQRFDPGRTALGGWTGSVNVNRQSGSVRVNAAIWATSPGFESNDLGFNPRSDRWGGHLVLQLRKSQPDGLTRYRSLLVARAYSLNFDREKQSDSLDVYARASLLNYWNLGLSGFVRWRSLADGATRGGPSMLSGQSAGGGFWLESDDRKRVNAVLRWEWRPGSAIYAVWAQQREDAADPRSGDLGQGLDTLFGSPATDAFQVKATFRLGD